MVHRTDSAGSVGSNMGQAGPGNAGVCRRAADSVIFTKLLRPNPGSFLPATASTAAVAAAAVPSFHAIYLKPLLKLLLKPLAH
jgi:hypothetical protein